MSTIREEKYFDRALAQAAGCTCIWDEDPNSGGYNRVVLFRDDRCPIWDMVTRGLKHPPASGVGPRITREFMFMEIARVVAKRSTCRRGSVGSLIVRDGRIVSTGYNGAPPGMPHCLEEGCIIAPDRANEGCQRAVHAEANALAWAARFGVATAGASLWSTHGPCPKCSQLILSAGIVEVNYDKEYRLSDGVKLLSEAGITVISHSD